MDLEEYLLGLLAIISGLAITEMVAGLHGLLFNRQRVRWDWLTPLTALFLAYAILASWWVSWQSFHDRYDSVMLAHFVVPVAQLVCLFVAARGILPSEFPREGDDKLDLAAHYFSVKRYVWGAMAANSVLLLVSYGQRIAAGRTSVWSGTAFDLPMLIVGLLYYLALALVDNRLFHRIAVPIAFVLIVSLTITQRIVD